MQNVRETNPAVRGLDLSSYLLIPSEYQFQFYTYPFLDHFNHSAFAHSDSQLLSRHTIHAAFREGAKVRGGKRRRRKEEGGRRKEEGGRRKEEGGRRNKE